MSLSQGGALTFVEYLDSPLGLVMIARGESKEDEPGAKWVFKPVILSSPPQDVVNCCGIFNCYQISSLDLSRPVIAVLIFEVPSGLQP